MKKFKFLILMLFLLMPAMINAKEVNVYLFHGDGCPHCASEIEYLEEIEKEYNEVNINLYEVWYNEDNQKLMKKVKIVGIK